MNHQTLKLNTFILFIIIFLISFNHQVKADQSNSPIGIIDLNLILSESKAAKKAAEEIEVIAKEIEEKMKKTETDLISEQNELAESQAVMTQESFQNKMSDFTKKVENFNISRQEELSYLDNLVADARLQVLNALEPILEDITNDKNLSVILDKSIVLLNNEKLDITKEVLKKLNKDLPSIKISKE